MSFETPPKKEPLSIPQENTLPLNIKSSEKFAEGGESTIWKASVKEQDSFDRLVALKQIKKEGFSDETEMRKSKEFYEFLKSFPQFEKFIPNTFYFKAQMTPESEPQAFCLQPFIEGERIDRLTDDQLYSDPETVSQLIDFVGAASDVLETTRENKMIKPDFMWTPESTKLKVLVGAMLSDPRYSSNIILAKNPDPNGQRIFFVDTNMNADERTKKIEQLRGRYLVGPLHELQFKRWRKKLEKVLAQKFNGAP